MSDTDPPEGPFAATATAAVICGALYAWRLGTDRWNPSDPMPPPLRDTVRPAYRYGRSANGRQRYRHPGDAGVNHSHGTAPRTIAIQTLSCQKETHHVD